jgi:Zn-dependent protease with chaperone function
MNSSSLPHTAVRAAGVLLILALMLAPGSSRAASTDAAIASPDSAAADSAFLQAPALEPEAAEPAPPPARDYLAEMRAGFTPENRAYARTKMLLRIVRPLAGIGLALLALFSGLSAALRDVAHGLGHRRYPRLLVFVILYGLVMSLLELPLSWYDSFALEHQFGLSNQTFAAWLGDEGKALLVAIVTFAVVPILWLVYSAIARSPQRWWLWLATGAIPFVIAGTLLQPLVVDPLFNTFRPLHNRELEGRILALAQRADIPARRVFEVDKSAQTNKINAYVSGFGASQRIVLWDTAVKALRDDEILFVMGHEIGHYRLGHIWKGIAFSCALGFVLLLLTQLLCTLALRRFGGRWGIHGMDDVASLPLLIATIALLAFVAQPLVNGYSRQVETEADVFGLEVTGDRDAAARAFLALARENRSDPEPRPWVKYLLYSHPPGIERVRLALEYQPTPD